MQLKLMEVGDMLLQVQEPGGKQIDLIGLSTSEISELLAGETGTSIGLLVKKTDGREVTTTIIRARVSLEPTRSAVLRHARLPEKLIVSTVFIIS